MSIIHHDPTIAKAVHETATKKLNDPEWEPFPITLMGDDLELGQRAFEVLRTLGYAKEQEMEFDDGETGYLGDLIHPRAKEYLVKYGREFVECLEAYMRLTNQPIIPHPAWARTTMSYRVRDITFPVDLTEDPKEYYGRNGFGKCLGLNLWDNASCIRITPINTTGTTSACMIDIPKKSIPELIETLHQLLEPLSRVS